MKRIPSPLPLPEIERGPIVALPMDGAPYAKGMAYRRRDDGSEALAVITGDVTRGLVPVRVHSECLTGDTFRSHRCDCHGQLRAAEARIRYEGVGAVLYMKGHEGRGVGLFDKLRIYKEMEEHGIDSYEACRRLRLP